VTSSHYLVLFEVNMVKEKTMSNGARVVCLSNFAEP